MSKIKKVTVIKTPFMIGDSSLLVEANLVDGTVVLIMRGVEWADF